LSEGEDGNVYDPKLYPSEKELMERYTFKFRIGVIPDPSKDVRVGSSKEQIQRFTNELTDQLNEQAKECYNTLVKRFFEEANHVEVRCDGYTGKRKGSFNDTLIPRLLNVAKLVKDTNIYEDDELDDLCSKVIKDYKDISSNDLREDEDLRKEASVKARTIQSALGKLKTSKY
jgi:hypothetical protein